MGWSDVGLHVSVGCWDIVCVGMVDFPRCLCVTYSRGIAGTVDLVKNIFEGMFDGRQWDQGDNVM